MLGALLANIRQASYPIQEGRGKRPIFWMQAQHPAIFEETKRKARELKEAMLRLKYLPEDHHLRVRFEEKARAYKLRKKPNMGEFRRRLDYLEMALDGVLTDELMELAIMLDDEEFFLVFDDK